MASITDVFGAGITEAVTSPGAFFQDTFGGDSGYVPGSDVPSYSTAPSVTSGASQQASNTNSAPVAGLNLLLNNPTAFFNTLFNGNADSVPVNDVKSAATKSVGANATQGLLNIPSWVIYSLAGVLIIVALGGTALVIHELKGL